MRYLASALTLLALAPAAASAQDIVVEGKRPSGTPDAVAAKVRAIAPRTGPEAPLPRFAQPVCFALSGLSAPAMRQMADRLAMNAEAAGIRLAGEGCKPNTALLFVNNGQVEAKDVLRKQAWLFGDASPRDVAAFTDAKGPVRLFERTSLEGDQGTKLTEGGKPTPYLNQVIDAPTLKVQTTSRVMLPIRQAIQSVALVIDRSAVVGKSPEQIADYATLRLLARAQYDARVDAGETVLSLFEQGAEAPAEMTALDRAYLRALYDGAGNQYASNQIMQAARLATGRTSLPPK